MNPLRKFNLNTIMVDSRWSIVFLWFIFLFMAVSCTTQKQWTYLQGVDENGPKNFYPFNIPDYRLQEQDILYVNFSTINDEINATLNAGSSTQGTQNLLLSENGAYLSGYAINDSGFINLPMIGYVSVLGKTMEEATKEIEDLTSQYLKDARVSVKLLSYRYTVLGEVKGPGTYRNYSKQLTIFDALGSAGDITNYGDRSKVLIVRSTNGGSHTFRINLLKEDILSSEGYFLLPNDIVIVEPLKIKFFQINSPTVTFFISTLVSTLSLTILITTIL